MSDVTTWQWLLLAGEVLAVATLGVLAARETLRQVRAHADDTHV